MNKPNTLASGLSGRDHYAELYLNELAREAEWLRRTASQKADAISRLLREAHLAPDSVLEVGAGTGAVIGELRRRGIGTDHFAVDFSEEAIAEVQRAEPGVHTAVADITVTPDPFGHGAYDLVFASHVIEHLDEPEAFLAALRAVPSDHFIAEVPLENLPFGKFKAIFKDRTKHTAGHVQFFDRSTFEILLSQSGWNIIRSMTYAPYLDAKTFKFAYSRSGIPQRTIKGLTEYVLPRILGPAWKMLYHAHCAALCVRSK